MSFWARVAAPLAAGLLMVSVAQARPVVVELFTSQACSDCPPAEALMARLQKADPGIIVLGEHVTYFNGPRWADRFATPELTARQGWYASMRAGGEEYTPQAIIDGRVVAVGSDRAAIVAAIAASAKRDAHSPVQVALARDGTGWRVSVSGTTPSHAASIMLFRYDAVETTAIRGGENRGVDLKQIHVVRALSGLGAWTGGAVTRHVDAGTTGSIAVIVQSDDGKVLGAASG